MDEYSLQCTAHSVHTFSLQNYVIIIYVIINKCLNLEFYLTFVYLIVWEYWTTMYLRGVKQCFRWFTIRESVSNKH